MYIHALVRPPSYTSSTPLGSLFIESDRLIAQINLENKSVSGGQHTIYSCSSLVYGPFDNGPLISVEGQTKLVAWQTGNHLKVSSEAICEGVIKVCVSPSRECPRIYTVSSEKGHVELISWGLRNLANNTSRLGGCFN